MYKYKCYVNARKLVGDYPDPLPIRYLLEVETKHQCVKLPQIVEAVKTQWGDVYDVRSVIWFKEV
jgi:hypothetical protein